MEKMFQVCYFTLHTFSTQAWCIVKCVCYFTCHCLVPLRFFCIVKCELKPTLLLNSPQLAKCEIIFGLCAFERQSEKTKTNMHPCLSYLSHNLASDVSFSSSKQRTIQSVYKFLSLRTPDNNTHMCLLKSLFQI